MDAGVPAENATNDAGRPRVFPEPALRMPWDAWGDRDSPARLPRGARAIAKTLLEGTPHPISRRATETVHLSVSRASAEDLEAIAAVVGTAHVSIADEHRLLHLGGKSTTDLLQRRTAKLTPAPDAVVSPANHEEVARVLRVCHERSIAVVPFGGGTSVVGGVDPQTGTHHAAISLHLARTAALICLDKVSLLATFGAGTTGPQAEALLKPHGLTLGHFPQSFAFASLGGYAATRSSGQASSGYGRFDDLVHALKVATPTGELDLGTAPASAAGPDLKELFLGSEGAFGVITEVTVRVRHIPAHTAYGAWTLPTFDAGAEALRELTQRGIHPTVIRLSDSTETRVNATIGGHLGRASGCLAIATFEAETRSEADVALARVQAVMRDHGAKDRGEEPARSWERGRFASPSMRDALLDIGVLAETLETATTWSQLAGLKQAVTAALTQTLAARGTKPIVMCHISHVYPAGASLYFTVVATLSDTPISQWLDAKNAASLAIGAAGGTITHHHAVGRDHRAYLESEVGALGIEILRAIKARLDPHAIMNPGVLIAPEAPRS